MASNCLLPCLTDCVWPLLGWLLTVCLAQIYHHCPYLALFCVLCLLVVPARAFLPFCLWPRRFSVAILWQVGVAWVCISGRRHFASSACSLPWLGLVALLSLAVLVKRGHLAAWVCMSGRVGACVIRVVVAFISVCLSFCLWPRQYGGTLQWQGRGGRGWHV